LNTEKLYDRWKNICKWIWG